MQYDLALSNKGGNVSGAGAAPLLARGGVVRGAEGLLFLSWFS